MKKSLVLSIGIPLVCILLAGGAWGTVTPPTESCVDNAAALQAALTAAQSNGADDIIKVVQGTYSGNFTYASSQSYDINVQGGYTAGCMSRAVNPTNTILDGGGAGSALALENYTTSGITSGSITVDGFTLRNGGGANTYYGAGIYACSKNGSVTGSMISRDITITNNIVKENVASTSGGGVYASSQSSHGASGNITVANNLITGNAATGNYAGGVWADSYSANGTAATVTLTNNTIVGNTADESGGGVYINVFAAAVGVANCHNNIIRGNTAPAGGDLSVYAGVKNGSYNNYHVMQGSWTNSSGNIDADPQFIGSGSYRLKPTSPCIDAGLNSAPGIPSTDIMGHDRIVDGNHDGTATIDMGAYEYNPVSAPHDVNADGISDILLRNTATDVSALWFMNDNGTVKSTKTLFTAANSTIVGTGDFNNDGISDLLKRDTDVGRMSIWFMNTDGTRASYKTIFTEVNSTVVGTGDFNADGVCDLIKRDSVTGQSVLWFMNADGTRASYKVLFTDVNSTVAGTGDFNGDGICDLIKRNSVSGQTVLWFMNANGTRASYKIILSMATWTVAGTADVNGDGVTDIIWRNTSTNQHNLWLMNADGTHASPVTLLALANWSFAGTGDINGDGRTDLIWRSTSGLTRIWFMNADGSHETPVTLLNDVNWVVVP